jgi:predicted metal-dependent hydrolase
MNREEAEEKFRRGIEQFNRGEYFTAHETWEEVWLQTAEPEKTFLQGLIQVTAAYHHYTRENHAGTRSLLAAGLAKLEKFPARHRGCEIERLRAAVRRWIEDLAAKREPGAEEIPKLGADTREF